MERGMKRTFPLIAVVLVVALGVFALAGCSGGTSLGKQETSKTTFDKPAEDTSKSDASKASTEKKDEKAEDAKKDEKAEDTEKKDEAADDAEKKEESDDKAETSSDSKDSSAKASSGASADALRAKLNITEDFRSVFNHGDKSAKYQKYIVLHDTEGSGNAKSVISGWINDGNCISSHFIINKDGSIWQVTPMDRIAHHAGYGNPGKNEKYGVTDESRDDKKGTSKATKSLPDYGMNSYSIGIEMVHVGNAEYPEAQLEALDGLIAYIDAYYGFESTIIDHKMWRDGNSDTSSAFKSYLANYRDHRTHN